MRAHGTLLAIAGLMALGACGGTYEEVAVQPPIYCYQSLAAVTCLDEPYRRDDERLVNYIGPPPAFYPAPLPPPRPPLRAPAAVDYWVKDSEPQPKAAH